MTQETSSSPQPRGRRWPLVAGLTAVAAVALVATLADRRRAPRIGSRPPPTPRQPRSRRTALRPPGRAESSTSAGSPRPARTGRRPPALGGGSPGAAPGWAPSRSRRSTARSSRSRRPTAGRERSTRPARDHPRRRHDRGRRPRRRRRDRAAPEAPGGRVVQGHRDHGDPAEGRRAGLRRRVVQPHPHHPRRGEGHREADLVDDLPARQGEGRQVGRRGRHAGRGDRDEGRRRHR